MNGRTYEYEAMHSSRDVTQRSQACASCVREQRCTRYAGEGEGEAGTRGEKHDKDKDKMARSGI